MRMIRVFFAAKTAIFRAVPLMRDERVPLALKLTAATIGLLVISPIDIFGYIPVLGALDDATLLILLCMWFVAQAAKHVEPAPVSPARGNGSMLVANR